MKYVVKIGEGCQACQGSIPLKEWEEAEPSMIVLECAPKCPQVRCLNLFVLAGEETPEECKLPYESLLSRTKQCP